MSWNPDDTANGTTFWLAILHFPASLRGMWELFAWLPIPMARVQLCVVLGERMAGELEGAHLYSEALIAQLAKEAENGRLLRLLARLSMVVDRPAGDPDAHWSETGLSSQLQMTGRVQSQL